MGAGGPLVGVHRRTVAAGVAWSVPVVLVGAAAPAFAASATPSFRLEDVLSANAGDEIRLINDGTVPIPSGTTITWQLQNTSDYDNDFSLDVLDGITRTSGPVSAFLAPGASLTLTFRITNAIPVGGRVAWSFFIDDYTYSSRATLSFASTTHPEYPSISRCVSNLYDTPGTLCPT